MSFLIEPIDITCKSNNCDNFGCACDDNCYEPECAGVDLP